MMRLIGIVVVSVALRGGVAWGAGPAEVKAAEPTRIVGVAKEASGRALVVRYRKAEAQRTLRFEFPGVVADYRSCPMMGDFGVAVAAAVRGKNGLEFYYRSAPFWKDDVAEGVRIPAPAGKFQLMGILNTQGDSIVVTAIRHVRESNKQSITGWYYTNNCPIPDVEVGSLTTFTMPLAADRVVEKPGSPAK